MTSSTELKDYAAESNSTPKEGKKKFVFLHSQWLSNVGLVDRSDQYVFYGTFGTGLYKFARFHYKHYLMREYIKETNPSLKTIIGGRFPFREMELQNAELFLKVFKNRPRNYLMAYSSLFVIFQLIKRGPLFWPVKD